MIKKLSVLVLGLWTVTLAFAELSQQEMKLLQDPGGWEYIRISDDDAGVQTEHVCFDGQPHPGQCSGKVTLNPDNSFVQEVKIHGQTVSRHGTYQIDEDGISFFDEFGIRDGPYAMQLDANAKWLVLSMPQVKLELELESQYKDDLKKKKTPNR